MPVIRMYAPCWFCNGFCNPLIELRPIFRVSWIKGSITSQTSHQLIHFSLIQRGGSLVGEYRLNIEKLADWKCATNG